MSTRNRITGCEKEAVLAWQQVVGRRLTSPEGEPLSVIYPGRYSGDGGPDFRDAVIVNKSQLVKGDVEVHVRSSDWYSHKHNTDAKYNNVILHVVLWDDGNSPTLLQSGKPIPVLCLCQAFPYQAYLLPRRLPCFEIGDRLGKRSLEKLLKVAGEERFEQKARHFQIEILCPDGIRTEKQQAKQVLFRGMARALGYSKNCEPFENLADRMPLSSLESTRGVAEKQALLLGTAGLLPSQRQRRKFTQEEEVEELQRIWQLTRTKVEPMKESDWNLSSIYPNNSPVRRIVALTYLVERYRQQGLLGSILQLVREAALSDSYRILENGLTVESHGYWLYHLDFGIKSNRKVSALLGKNKAGEMLVNVILPFTFAWGKIANEAKLADGAMRLYHSYRGLAENWLTRHMAKQFGVEGFSDFSACHQQGLIHIFRNYCREGGCRECALAG